MTLCPCAKALCVPKKLANELWEIHLFAPEYRERQFCGNPQLNTCAPLCNLGETEKLLPNPRCAACKKFSFGPHRHSRHRLALRFQQYNTRLCRTHCWSNCFLSAYSGCLFLSSNQKEVKMLLFQPQPQIYFLDTNARKLNLLNRKKKLFF